MTEEDAVPPEAAAPFEQFSYQDAGSVMTTSSIHSRTSLPMTALSEWKICALPKQFNDLITTILMELFIKYPFKSSREKFELKDY